MLLSEFDIEIPVDWCGKTCVRVCDFKNKQIRSSVIDSEKKVTDKEEIEIEFDYPLSKSALLRFQNKHGFTIGDIFKAIYDGYKHIYALEDDPWYVPGMLNRAPSEGGYGIWGHYMEDLFIEGVYQHKPGRFTLSMGS